MKTITVSTKASNNINWADAPTTIACTFTEADLQKYADTLALPTDADCFCWGWNVNYELFDDLGVNFEPSYSLNGSTTKLFKDGSITVVIYLKHSSEEIFGEFNLNNLLEQLKSTPDLT